MLDQIKCCANCVNLEVDVGCPIAATIKSFREADSPDWDTRPNDCACWESKEEFVSQLKPSTSHD